MVNKRTMKKIIVAMVLMLGFQMIQAQTVDRLFSEFRGEENATCVKVPWLPIKLVGLFADDKDGRVIRHISSIRVLDLSDCSQQVQERFATELQQLKMKGYEPLLTVKDDGSHVKMWGQMENKRISELVIGVTGDGDATLCCIKGNLSIDDLNFSMSDGNISLASGK